MNRFQVGDRVRHVRHGDGVVILHRRGNHNSIPVKFDSGYTKGNPWGYLASPEFLTKIDDLVEENE